MGTTTQGKLEETKAKQQKVYYVKRTCCLSNTELC